MDQPPVEGPVERGGSPSPRQCFGFKGMSSCSAPCCGTPTSRCRPQLRKDLKSGALLRMTCNIDKRSVLLRVILNRV